MNTTTYLEKENLSIDFESNIEKIYKDYFAFVCSAIYRLIPDKGITEDLAQEVFYHLWSRRETIRIEISLSAYLKKAAVNKALNYLRKKDALRHSDDIDMLLDVSSKESKDQLEYMELQTYIDKAIDKLPSKCRTVFMLSRFEEYSYAEIAAELNIAKKTVENQISKALKALRKALKKYENQVGHKTSYYSYLNQAC